MWLALWSKALPRFETVLELCKQRHIPAETKMEYRPPVSLPRPYMQLGLDVVKHEVIWREIVDFALDGFKIHVVDMRGYLASEKGWRAAVEGGPSEGGVGGGAAGTSNETGALAGAAPGVVVAPGFEVV